MTAAERELLIALARAVGAELNARGWDPNQNPLKRLQNSIEAVKKEAAE